MEIPRHWRNIRKRERFTTKVLTQTSDYLVVEGFGSSIHVISKTGGNNFQIQADWSEKAIYPADIISNDHGEVAITVERGSIFDNKNKVLV